MWDDLGVVGVTQGSLNLKALEPVFAQSVQLSVWYIRRVPRVSRMHALEPDRVLFGYLNPQAFLLGGFPKLGVPSLGVPIIRIIVYWGLYWGPLILGNYHLGFRVAVLTTSTVEVSSRAFLVGKVGASERPMHYPNNGASHGQAT